MSVGMYACSMCFVLWMILHLEAYQIPLRLSSMWKQRVKRTRTRPQSRAQVSVWEATCWPSGCGWRCGGRSVAKGQVVHGFCDDIVR
uniref:Putative secreted protein n=1 Tax=Anopheles darlingi TaxID=43151 RepID=A0A2M4DH04_ANODA